MKLARLIVLVALMGALAAPVSAGGLCGVAQNFGNGAQGKVRLKRYRRTETGVEAKLVCKKWKTICNGRVGTIDATIGTFPGTEVPRLQGNLRYKSGLICGVYCQVEGSVDTPAMLFCQFNCPAGSNAQQVSFTVGPTVCK